MTSSRFYVTDPGDLFAPVVLDECEGAGGTTIRPGDQVVYENPAFRQADGSYWTGGMDPPLTVAEIVDFGDGTQPQAIVNDGKYEVAACNLRPDEARNALWERAWEQARATDRSTGSIAAELEDGLRQLEPRRRP